MSWAGAMTALHANLLLAASDVTPAIGTVKEGEPDNLDTDVVAYWVGAGRSSQTGGNTLSKVNWERGVTVTAYIRGSVRAGSIDSATERRIVAIEEALLTRLWADWDLSSNAIAIDIEASEYGWSVVGGQLARTVSLMAWIDLAEVAAIAANP